MMNKYAKGIRTGVLFAWNKVSRMTEAIIVAIIAAGASLVGTILTVLASAKKTENNMQVAQAVTDTKIDELTREVRSHNDFASRIPVIEEQIKVANHRIDDLEKRTA